MNDWLLTPIKKMGRVVTGKTPPKANLEYFDGECLFVSPKDLDWDAQYITNTQTKITEKALEKFRNQVLPKNAVMFTSLSFAFGKIGLASQPLLTNQQINSVIANKDHYFRFIYYLLRANRPLIFSYNSGIDTPIVPKSVFESIKLPCPHLKLQKKIAAVLSAYDDLIENNNKRIALLEKAAEEIYREWFVRLRFPGWETAVFHKGIPEGWEVIKVAHAFDFTGGGTPSKKENRYWDDGTVNWFTPTDITAANGIFLSNSGLQCTEEGFNNSSAKLFPAYSIMMTSRATIGAIGINTTPACTNQGFITCIPNEHFPMTYLYYWLRLSKPYFELLSTGATFSELTKGTFKKINIIKPERKMVLKFDEIVSPTFKMIEVLLNETKLLKQTRDLLLSRLISGKLPVDDLDINFPPSMIAPKEPAHA